MLNNKNVIKNASWIIICRCIQAFLSLLVTLLTARYLGPSNYGILNYAIAVTAFFIPVSLLGINSVLVQELINNKDHEGTVIGTSLTLSFCSSVLCIGGIALFVLITNPGEPLTLLVCVLYATMLLFQSLEMIQYWFQAHLLSKYTSIVSLIAYIIISVYKIILLITKMDVQWFAVSYSFDYLLISSILLYIYNKKFKTTPFKFSWEVAKGILNKSKYYIISSLMVTFFAQQDKVMIKLMIDNEATGYYSAAVTCATMSGFIFTAIIDSVRPVIFSAKKEDDEDQYENVIVSLYSIVIYLCILQGLACTILAKYIIRILYGAGYEPAVLTLRIIIWYSAFSFIGGIRDIWLLSENKQNYLVWINLIGALINFGLNIFLINLIGINGAAIASVFTQFFTNVVLTCFIKPIRRNNHFILEALNPRYAYSNGIRIIRSMIKR